MIRWKAKWMKPRLYPDLGVNTIRWLAPLNPVVTITTTALGTDHLLRYAVSHNVAVCFRILQ